MPSAGEMLRSERLRQNRSLAELATTTCIGARYLEAIENDDRQALPGEFFYRSFAKQYATALGLEPAEVETALQPPEEAEPVLTLEALDPGYQVAKLEGRNSWLRSVRAVWTLGLLGVSLAGGAGLYAWWENRQAEPEPANSGSPAPAPAPTVQVTPVEQAEATERARSQDPPSARVIEPGKLSLDIAAKETVWVSLKSDGKTVFSGILQPEQSRTVENVEAARLMTGNAGGLDVRWNGRPIGPIGERGQVRIVDFTPENYHILPWRKM